MGKSVQEYLILQGPCEFFPRLYSRTTQYSLEIDIFSRITYFSSVPPLSIQQLFLSAQVVLSSITQIPKQKHNSEHCFKRTARGDYFWYKNKISMTLAVDSLEFSNGKRETIASS